MLVGIGERGGLRRGRRRPHELRGRLQILSETALIPLDGVHGGRNGGVALTDNDLLPLLRERLLGAYSPLLADTTASLLFTAGGMANWTVEIDRGRALAKRGGPANPTTTVRAPLRVLDDVVVRGPQRHRGIPVR